MSSRNRSSQKRLTRFEKFESRIVFNVDPVIADWAQLELDSQQDVQSNAQTPGQFSVADIQGTSDAEYVFTDYGFDGTGQTIAVIDSGIAWDHYALGGAYGENARVVGGWDFAEGDADPYDDGPAGYHGTHVAGIIGSDDANHRGVASGADLVALRVFDDNGGGNLDWVEQALQWVHEHKDSFTNPITTVNLSLGVDWNAENTPDWASLEDEFAQLEADNIFISVAAGNAFQNYNAAGLAYPAASEHVVPVASHDASGSLSDFSQRNDRVLVAPGESIQSTVPGHLYGQADSSDFLGSSGTSMAAPYVAGASAILRQAMQFMGTTEISQESLYQHFRDTATQFHDSVTQGIYHRIDLGAAIDAIITDAHASSLEQATDLGILGDSDLVQGTIGKVNDVDSFAFQASQSGQLTITVAQSHALDSVLRINGQALEVQNGKAVFDVQYGGDYVVSISTSNGIGHYDLNFEISSVEPSIIPTDIGPISNQHLSGLSVEGERWFSLSAANTGILSAQIDQTETSIQVYDQNMSLVSQADSQNGHVRADNWAEAGQTFYLKVVGNDSNFDLNINNQVSLIDGFLAIHGTEQQDNFSIRHNSETNSLQLEVAATTYQFTLDVVSHIHINGNGAADQLSLHLEGLSNEVFLLPNEAHVFSSDFTLSSEQLTSISAHGSSTDKVVFLDSLLDDTFVSGQSHSLSGSGFENTSFGFGNVQAVSRNGNDSATINGTSEADQFSVTNGVASHIHQDGQTVATGFVNVRVNGDDGNDTLVIHGTEFSDTFSMRGGSTNANLNGMAVDSFDIEQTIVVANDKNDIVNINGTSSDEFLYSTESTTILTGGGFQNVALGSGNVIANVNGPDSGTDNAWLADTAGNDQVTGDRQSARIIGNDTDRQAIGFDSVTVAAENGGVDHAVFFGSSGNDSMYSLANSTWVWGAGYQMGLVGFTNITVFGGGGHDSVAFQGGIEDTTFDVAGNETKMSGSEYTVRANGFETQQLNGGQNQNRIRIRGIDQDDTVTGQDSALVAWLDETSIRAENFTWLDAEAEEDATASHELDAVDFWYELHGDWQ